jgi:hypothetical protein
VDTMASLVAWVEEGIAPKNLTGSFTTRNGTTASKPICLWPEVAKHIGGDENDFSSYQCGPSF